MMGDDDAVAFEVEIRALDRDDADVEFNRQLADRGQRVPGWPVPDGDAPPDLLDDLEVHRAAIAMGEDDASEHLYILSIHRAQCCQPGAAAEANLARSIAQSGVRS